ncbi:MAG: helix-turn-helix transcriptional regulator [Firmicutes bacterium]|nr:helix-turn-helix transcriptional regulator [Bacillota bacterium]
MNYIEMVNDAIQYIESNLDRKLSLEELAFRYYISPMHFYRIFRAATNQTVKSYILARKLSAAAIALKTSNHNVTEIAFRHGFNSLEQFIRDFKKVFLVTPSRYRRGNIPISIVEQMDIVERDLKNENRDIIINYSCRELKQIKLLGKEIHFNPWDSCELEEMIRNMIIDFHHKYVVQGAVSVK